MPGVKGVKSDFTWLQSLKDNYGVTTEEHSDAMGLLEKFQEEVDGYVIGEWMTPHLIRQPRWNKIGLKRLPIT